MVAPAAVNSTDPPISFVKVATLCKEWWSLSSSNKWTSNVWLPIVVEEVAEDDSVEEFGRSTLSGE